jgi:hypothetical protein
MLFKVAAQNVSIQNVKVSKCESRITYSVTKRSYVHQYEKTNFLMPHSTYSKKKSFHLLKGTMNLFEELKRGKMEETTPYFENQFFINRS